MIRRLVPLLAIALVACATVSTETPTAPPSGGAVATGSPPAAGGPRPTRLVAVSGEPREVPLRWQPLLRGPVTGYRILRREAGTPGSPFVEVARVAGASAASFLDRGGAPVDRPARLADETRYVYVVEAEAPGWRSAPSEPAYATTAAPPPPPDGLEAGAPRADAIILAWEPSRDPRVAGYRVYRAAFTTGPFEPLGDCSGRFATTFADSTRSGIQRLRTYYYRVAAVSAAGAEGPPGAPVPAWLKPHPVAPLDVAAVGGLARQVRLRWTLGHEHDLQTVTIWRAAGDGPFVRLRAVPAAQREHLDAGLADGVTYRYRLTIEDADGLESEPSLVTAATTRSLPSAPRDLTASRDRDGVTLRWRAAPPSAGVARYRVLRINTFGRAEVIAEVAGTAARDTAPGVRYAVVAVDVEGLESPPSAAIEPPPPTQASR
jgi:fibronectin type 3 domain-containing protein